LLLNDDSDRLPPVEFFPLDDNVAGMKDPRNESQHSQANINEEVTPTSSRSTEGEWRKDQRQKEKTAVGASHLESLVDV